MTRILFVCLGNICRSPMAMAIFRKKVKDAGLEIKFEIDSCGTANYHLGKEADPRTVEVLNNNGVSITHTVRQLSLKDFYHFDYIIAMDKSNLSDIFYMKPEDSMAKVRLFRDFDPQSEDGEVPDPYYGGMEEFQSTFEIIERTSEAFLNHLKK